MYLLITSSLHYHYIILHVHIYSLKARWLRREIELPELFKPRTKELLTVIKSASPLDVLCLQEFSTDERIVTMFNEALGSK